MAGHETFNNEIIHVNRHTLLTSVSIRDAFLDWLSAGHSPKYTPDVLVNCLDNISKYMLQRKMNEVDLWSLSKDSLFLPIYNGILKNKLFQMLHRNTYRVFVIAGQLYLEFLKEKPFAKEKVLLNELTDVNNTTELFPQDMVVPAPIGKYDNVTLLVDFMHPELCAQTRPVDCIINGRVVIPDKQNWSRLLVAVTERFIAEQNPNLAVLVSKPLYGSKVFFMSQKADSGNCCELSNGKWIYTNYSSPTIITIIGNLCQHCEAALNDVVIRYLPKGAPFEQSAEPAARVDGDVATVISPKIVLEPALAEMIIDVMSAHFSNGFRIDSPIELLRFRRFAAEDFDDEISITDEELMKAIASCGTLFDGKVYVISPETVARIQKEFDAAFANGAETVFFEAFYDKHEEWLFPSSVVSVDMLKNILLKLYPNYSHRGNYITSSIDSKTELARIEYEIVRVWGEDVLHSYFQLAEHLPYIPLEKIKYALACNGDFIWNSDGVYTHVNKVDITKEERAEIADFVAKSCLADGYASLSNIPLGEIQERNYELTLTAIHNAAFRICLADKYDRNGKIVTRKGDVLNALTIMKDYCRTIDKCSLDDLLNYEKELTGEVHRWIPMEAGYAVLVRIDKDAYVSEKYVDFNTTAIDNAIALFVTDDYLPLKSFTTFAAFPHCGQVWNLFLLESYCRRFSERFRFDTPSVNSRNAGAVIRKSCRLTYVEIMADAVAKSGVPCEEKAVGRFLYENGYTGRSTTAKAAEIIERAIDIRERSD